jgi:tetratricopeptide (TPR) repeat protein
VGVLRNIVVLAALVAVILVGQKAWIYYSGPAKNDAKDSQQQVDRCANADNRFTPDESINGCTAAAQSGRRSGQDLAAVFLNRGRAFANKGELDRAIADFNEAIRLNPNDATFAAIANYNRGGVYQAKDDLDRAIADFNEAIRLDPQFADAYNNRGNAHRVKRNFDLAIADFDAAIRLSGQHSASAEGQAGAANGIEASDGNGAYSYANRGAAYAAKGDLDHAIADFDDAIRLDPKFAGAYFNRGSAYQVKGDLDRAIADFNEAIRLDPKLTAACYRRGKAYADQGDLDRGLADLKACLQRLEEPGQ